MSKSKKGCLYGRLTNALSRLEKQYEAFKAAKEDKQPWDTTRNGRVKHHAGRTYADECKRLAEEIANTKSHLSKLYK